MIGPSVVIIVSVIVVVGGYLEKAHGYFSKLLNFLKGRKKKKELITQFDIFGELFDLALNTKSVDIEENMIDSTRKVFEKSDAQDRPVYEILFLCQLIKSKKFASKESDFRGHIEHILRGEFNFPEEEKNSIIRIKNLLDKYRIFVKETTGKDIADRSSLREHLLSSYATQQLEREELLKDNKIKEEYLRTLKELLLNGYFYHMHLLKDSSQKILHKYRKRKVKSVVLIGHGYNAGSSAIVSYLNNENIPYIGGNLRYNGMRINCQIVLLDHKTDLNKFKEQLMPLIKKSEKGHLSAVPISDVSEIFFNPKETDPQVNAIKFLNQMGDKQEVTDEFIVWQLLQELDRTISMRECMDYLPLNIVYPQMKKEAKACLTDKENLIKMRNRFNIEKFKDWANPETEALVKFVFSLDGGDAISENTWSEYFDKSTREKKINKLYKLLEN